MARQGRPIKWKSDDPEFYFKCSKAMGKRIKQIALKDYEGNKGEALRQLIRYGLQMYEVQ